MLPFELDQHRRHRIPEQKHQVTNSLGALLRSWREHDGLVYGRGHQGVAGGAAHHPRRAAPVSFADITPRDRCAGEWLIERHGAKTRRSWRKLHTGLDADTGQIVAAVLTGQQIDDGAELGRLLDQVPGPLASFAADGACDRENVSTAVAERHPKAAVIVPPGSTAVPSETAAAAPTQRDRHLQRVEPRGSPDIAEHGRMAWRKASGYTKRARAEAAIGSFEQVVGDGLRSRSDERRAAEVGVAVHVLNRRLELGRPISIRIA